VITAYEDRPMTEMVKAHLGPLAGMVSDAPDADIVLYINAPAEVQGNGPDQWALALREAEHGGAARQPAQQALCKLSPAEQWRDDAARDVHRAPRPAGVRAQPDALTWRPGKRAPWSMSPLSMPATWR
jgi:hypothetical protein